MDRGPRSVIAPSPERALALSASTEAITVRKARIDASTTAIAARRAVGLDWGAPAMYPDSAPGEAD
ncbi:MAG: hypothetical protein WBL45_12035 [Solirubrobacterales bacterium]